MSETRTPEQQKVVDALRARDEANGKPNDVVLGDRSAARVAAAQAVAEAMAAYNTAKEDEVRVLQEINERKAAAEARLQTALDGVASVFLDLYNALPKNVQNKVRHVINTNK